MALITITDLPQSDDLDREAMRSISGGARTSGSTGGRSGGRPARIDPASAGSGRIVDYPPGFGHQAQVPAKT